MRLLIVLVCLLFMGCDMHMTHASTGDVTTTKLSGTSVRIVDFEHNGCLFLLAESRHSVDEGYAMLHHPTCKNPLHNEGSK